jgi:kumamolisin
VIHRALARRVVVCTCLVVLAFTASACAVADRGQPGPAPGRSSAIAGPLASLLADSTDLGVSTRRDISSVVALAEAVRPGVLQRWAQRHGLSVGWQPGDAWASLSGSAAAMGAALDVSVHDYRSRTGHVFYAAQRQPRVPAPVRHEVTQIGRVLDYSPSIEAAGAGAPSDGLSPSQLVTAYDANTVAAASGHTTGTVVLFEFGPYKQSDLNAFAASAGLPRFQPQYYGGVPSLANAADETELDAEVVHAIAPDARIVIANAEPTLDGSSEASVGLSVGQLFTLVDQRFPGAVWSLSIGWGCERFFTGADLQPVESALATAESHGTSAFDASGDTAGLECKGNADYSTPPRSSDIGVEAVSSLPAMTSVGGTRLATDAQGHWAAEEAWDESSQSQGGSGGVSKLQARPSWQVAPTISGLRGTGHRLVPDVSADADPDTGVALVLDGESNKGGGTSQAAPIWAGFTALMDDYLQHHGGRLIGAINPLLYRIAGNIGLPAFHDITLGADAVDLAKPGYDLVTGLGTPMIDNLVQDLLTAQRGGS